MACGAHAVLSVAVVGEAATIRGTASGARAAVELAFGASAEDGGGAGEGGHAAVREATADDAVALL